MLVGTPTIQTEVSIALLDPSRKSMGQLLKLGHDLYIPHPFTGIINQIVLPFHATWSDNMTVSLNKPQTNKTHQPGFS
jgi:hypothetical protein